MASNLSVATRTFVEKVWKSHIAYGMPLLTRLLERGQIFPGGTQFEQVAETADMESLVQYYGPNDPLVGGSKELLEKPKWSRAYATLPILKTIDEEIMNAPAGDAQLVAIAKNYAKTGLRSLKQSLNKHFYGNAGDAEIDSLHTLPQGLCSALKEDNTYGGLTRTGSTVNEWFQSADYAAWDTAASMNKASLWNWLDSIMEFVEGPGDVLIIMGPTLYQRLKGQMEAFHSYEPEGNAASQGFDSMRIDGYEIAKDWRLDRLVETDIKGRDGTTNIGLAGVGSTVGSTFVFVLNLNTINFRYASIGGGGPFSMSDFFLQDQVEGGSEKWLARLKFKGNLMVEQPNANLLRSNIT